MEQSIVNFQIFHEYFDQIPDDLFDLNACPNTQRLFSKLGISIIKHTHEIKIIFNERCLNTETLQEKLQGETLLFRISIKDDMFCHYTKLNCLNRLKFFYLPIVINNCTDREINSTKDTFIGEKDMISLSDLPSFIPESIFNTNRLSDILFNIRFNSTDVLSDFLKSKALINIKLNFQCRATKWRYHVKLENHSAKNEHYILDKNQHFEFRTIKSNCLGKDETYITFESKTPIPFRQKSVYSFQLFEKKKDEETVLIKALPLAMPNLTIKENNKYTTKEFANIHVYI